MSAIVQITDAYPGIYLNPAATIEDDNCYLYDGSIEVDGSLEINTGFMGLIVSGSVIARGDIVITSGLSVGGCARAGGEFKSYEHPIAAGEDITAGLSINAGNNIFAGRDIIADFSIDCGASINAGRDIQAGWGITAGFSVRCKRRLKFYNNLFAGTASWCKADKEKCLVEAATIEGDVKYGTVRILEPLP